MLPETEFTLYGISKQPYKFKVHPINIKLPSDFGGLYVYTNYTSNGRELIYGGRTNDISDRHEGHKNLKDKPIDEKIMSLAAYIGVWYTLDLNNLEELEIDLLEGNEFKLNTQHNQTIKLLNSSDKGDVSQV